MTPAPWTPWLAELVDGTPDVSGLRCTRLVHDDGRPYLDRYHLVDTEAVSVRLHHWRSGDDQRAPHDHPWPNMTAVVVGELLEHTASGDLALEPGAIVTRPAAEAHTIDLVTDDAWTLFVTGHIERRWGFYTSSGWVHWSEWPYAGRVLDAAAR
jgi:hypothetical protein